MYPAPHGLHRGGNPGEGQSALGCCLPEQAGQLPLEDAMRQFDWQVPSVMRFRIRRGSLWELSRKRPRENLSGRERDYILKEFAVVLKSFPAGKRFMETLLKQPFGRIAQHHALWQGISTCIACGFVEETDSVLHYSQSWWILVTRTFLQSGNHTAATLWKQYANECSMSFLAMC